MVLLGFIDPPKGGKSGNDDDPANWTVSRIGGSPVSGRVEWEWRLWNRAVELGISTRGSDGDIEKLAGVLEMSTGAGVCLSTLLPIGRAQVRSSVVSLRLSKSHLLECVEQVRVLPG